ncbi:MAG: sugar phosphate isomerase/epimerase family protein, partial [Chloroflexota bacterium]
VQLMAEHAPDAPLDLEIITGSGGPKHIPYLDPSSDYWKMYPDMAAPDFARFVALAQRGTPEPLHQITLARGPGVVPDDALRAQQRRHLEESVAYCKDVLGLGERR